MVTKVIYNSELDDYIIELDEAMMDELGLSIGDIIEWIDNGDGSYTLRKKVENDGK